MRSRNAIDGVRSILKGLLRLGVSPSNPTPADGDMWVTTTDLNIQVGGSTIKVADKDTLSSRDFYGAFYGSR